MACFFKKMPLLWLLAAAPLAAQNGFPLQAEGFDSHVELRWKAQAGAASYKILRSPDGQVFTPLKTVGDTAALDFTGSQGTAGTTFFYQIEADGPGGPLLFSSEKKSATVAEQPDSALLDMVERYTFRYFWDFAHPVSAMARERNSSGDIVTTGGTGFGVMAVLVGVRRGFIAREQGRDRLLQLVGFLQFADRFHGVFPHWMDGTTGNTIPFASAQDNGGDLVETAFLMEGLLTARQFFDKSDPYEAALRQAITQLWEEVEWDFYRKNGSGVLYWHWSPTDGWALNHQVRGWNEAMMVYLLAVASPTHPVPASLWKTGWAGSGYVNGATYYGEKLPIGPNKGGPLFFAHYSFLGFDPRGRKDAFCNYFTQNVAHSRINQRYCKTNPKGFAGYSADCWGLTASDDPGGYLAHEPNNDNGTLTPSAALSSMPYTPDESMAALKCFYRNKGAALWGMMGFFDAFNEQKNWTADSYLAIDQGPIVGMIENFRSGLLWENFMKNPEIEPALTAIGFMPDATATSEPTGDLFLKISPNPAGGRAFVEFSKITNEPVEVRLFSASGLLVLMATAGAGLPGVELDLDRLPNGAYFLRTEGSAARLLKL